MKAPSINKNHAAVIITVLVLIFLGAAYFFIYLPRNERRIQEQRFSALRSIDRNIHTKVENSIALLNNLLNAYQAADKPGREKLNRYIAGYSSANFKLTTPSIVTLSKQDRLKDSLNQDSGYTIKVDNNTREISLFFTKPAMLKGNDSTAFRMGMKFSFQQFLSFLLPKDVFDDYVVFSKGRPVYETFPAGISNVIEDSLLSVKNGFGSSGIRSQVVSGTDYKLFLQPVGFDSSNEWIVAGLLSDKHYQREKTELPTQMILLLATIMLMSMVAFPWLKLYQMGSKDRLTISDGIASIFISMLLVSLIFFVFFNYNHLLRPVEKNDSKISIADGIHSAFRSELDTVYSKLKQCDRLVQTANRDIIHLNDGAVRYASGDSIQPVTAAGIRAAARDININQVFWLNKNGDEIINWVADSVNAPHGNYKTRDYFKRIVDQRDFRVGGNSNESFFLEQLISWTSGTFRTVISTKSQLHSADSPVIAALSFNFKSLNKVVLPTGYLFAIADNQGNVLYHSESSRNLNENLLNVFSKGNKLRSFLNARVQGSFATKYYGNEYEVFVKPVSGLPYFIVVLEDAIFDETRDMETYSFTFSMLFIFFGLLVLQLFAIFLVSAKRSFFKKQLMDTTWIGPKRSNNREYILSSIFNSFIIILLIFLFSRSSLLNYIFMLLFAATYIPLFLNISFARRYLAEKRNVFRFKRLAKYCLIAFLVVICIAASRILDLRNFIYLLLFGAAVILVGEWLYAGRGNVLKVARRLKAPKKFAMLFGRWNYVNSFALMSLTRLIITSGLPIVFFYIISHNYEQHLSTRYKQVDFANRFLDKFPSTAPDSLISKSMKLNGVFAYGSLADTISIVSPQQAQVETGDKQYSKEEKWTIELLKLFRLAMTDKAVMEENYYTPGSEDSSFFFNHLLNEAIAKRTGTVTYHQSPVNGRYLKIQSRDMNYQYPSIFSRNWFYGGLFWFLLIVALVVFYFIICNIIKKLFALNLPDLETWKKLDSEILINKDSEQPLFVIGLPGAGKKKYLLDKIRHHEITMDDGSLYYINNPDKENNVFIAELINIPSSGNDEMEKIFWNEYTKKVFDEKHRMIIVNHFEYNIQDAVSNRFKLEFLERLFLEKKSKIIILSTIHPVAFLDSAMDFTVKEEDKSIPGQDLERWHVLLGHYRIVVLPLQLSSDYPIESALSGRVTDKGGQSGIAEAGVMVMGTTVEAFSRQDGTFALPKQDFPFKIVVSLRGYNTREIDINVAGDLLDIWLEEGPSGRWAKLIRQETNQTYFLTKLQTPAFEAGNNMPEEIKVAKFDELAFKLQVSSHYFYMYIWQSLTKEEKFLLYDLAEDNLVNSFDDYNLSMLVAKGVVIRPEGTLKLFNRGFRNFILTAIGNSEAMKIKNQIKDNGNWNTLKYPLQLIILAILAFLLTSQQEAFAKLITYAAALGAGVPAVLKIFTLFDKSSQKQS